MSEHNIARRTADVLRDLGLKRGWTKHLNPARVPLRQRVVREDTYQSARALLAECEAVPQPLPQRESCMVTVTDGACCCNCKHHVKDISHPLTDGGRVLDQRGWICLCPFFGGGFSEWSEHGMCEGWEAAS